VSEAFIQLTDPNGRPMHLKASSIEALCHEPEGPIIRVFVHGTGFYRTKLSQQEILTRLRDIEIMRDMEEKA
jgi:hypothetical protein